MGAAESEPPKAAMAQLPQTVPECHAVIAQLLERVKLLAERVNPDSSNSSKPPSSIGPGRMNRSQRRASERKRGAQPGHKGHSRAMLDESEVDSVVDCMPEAMCECGGQVQVADVPQRHRVFEVPPMRAQVDEYRLYRGRCAAAASILKLWSALWTFTTHGALVPTNNAAEQALRSLVLKRKISGPTRSLRGDHFLARGYTVHETCLRQGEDLWEFMHKAVHAAIAKTMPPSLLPGLKTVVAAPTG